MTTLQLYKTNNTPNVKIFWKRKRKRRNFQLGLFYYLLTTDTLEIGFKSAPNVLLWGLLMALNGPQMAPNGPHQHYVFIISPKAHNLGYFRPLWARKPSEIGFKSASCIFLWGL